MKKREREWNGTENFEKNYHHGFSLMKLFWGVLFILLAVFLILERTGVIVGISFWTVFFTVVFGVMLLGGLASRSFGSVFFAIAFLCIVYDDQLGITELTPWTVLFAAFLLTIGMNLLFHKRKGYKEYVRFMKNGGKHVISDGVASENRSASTASKIMQMNRFGELSKYIKSEMFESAFFDNSFGEMNIYFENAETVNNEGFVQVSNAFGELNIYIPCSWSADVDVKSMIGDVGIRGTEDGSRKFLLHVTGKSSFGEVNVIYMG